MQITTIGSPFTGNIIYIPQNINPEREFFYNEISAIIKKYRIPSVINKNGVKFDIPSEIPEITVNVENTLSELGIKFNKLA